MLEQRMCSEEPGALIAHAGSDRGRRGDPPPYRTQELGMPPALPYTVARARPGVLWRAGRATGGQARRAGLQAAPGARKATDDLHTPQPAALDSDVSDGDGRAAPRNHGDHGPQLPGHDQQVPARDGEHAGPRGRQARIDLPRYGIELTD